MDTYNIYKDIQARTGGEIYIGVVGPVRRVIFYFSYAYNLVIE